jgi:hypothetical protein
MAMKHGSEVGKLSREFSKGMRLAEISQNKNIAAMELP